MAEGGLHEFNPPDIAPAPWNSNEARDVPAKAIKSVPASVVEARRRHNHSGIPWESERSAEKWHQIKSERETVRLARDRMTASCVFDAYTKPTVEPAHSRIGAISSTHHNGSTGSIPPAHLRMSAPNPADRRLAGSATAIF